MNAKSLFMTVSAIIIVLIFALGILMPGLTDTIGLEGNKRYHNEGIGFAYPDGLEHRISVSHGDGHYVIDTDGVLTDYAEYVPPTSGVAGAIGIGVYEAYNNDGVLVSQAGRSPTVSTTMDDFRLLALANNTNNLNGTYQLWNHYQHTLYEMMCTAVLGNTDTQYMMGNGYVGRSAPIDTGFTTSAYQTSPNNSTPGCLFLENTWGNLNEYVGDMSFNNYMMSAGNTLGGHPYDYVVNALSSTVTIPSTSSKTITTIYLGSDSWGTPLTVGNASTAGQGINDVLYCATGFKLLATGGSWRANANAGIFSYAADQDVAGANNAGTRLAYVIPNSTSTAQYGYKIIMGEGGTTVSDVQVLSNGELVSTMPTGKTLNSYWAFDTETGIGPFGCYYAAINLASGPNNDDNSEDRLSVVKGEIAYVLNPYNYAQTINGSAYTPDLYNVMLIVPTVYWYSDGTSLYLGSAADVFEGIEMYPYAHAYTIADDVDTGNPAYVPDCMPIAIGHGSIIFLYADGNVYYIDGIERTLIGNADDGVDLILNGSTLSWSDGSMSAEVYLNPAGTMVMTTDAFVSQSTVLHSAVYKQNVTTNGAGLINIGYTMNGGWKSRPAPEILSPESNIGTISYISTETEEDITQKSGDIDTIRKITYEGTWTDGSVSEVSVTYLIVPAEVKDDSNLFMNTVFRTLPILIVIGAGLLAYLLIRR